TRRPLVAREPRQHGVAAREDDHRVLLPAVRGCTFRGAWWAARRRNVWPPRRAEVTATTNHQLRTTNHQLITNHPWCMLTGSIANHWDGTLPWLTRNHLQRSPTCFRKIAASRRPPISARTRTSVIRESTNVRKEIRKRSGRRSRRSSSGLRNG